ncbi:C-GCAxxG-C-C family protein [Sedimentibacter sp. MB31-C6]|uniref:C-GCAxxG-C-C family protein n=1 Tax=Sedimentibacter sp. MB31-C6 TaxID=3109366 RepID=UPI002DDC93DA|nr:C-GCAxxG-C-C family protein [Sedimentibacter sp. MB36-C1]WSI03817.1 C-GCAxxG-C-C family protein [Sedimentibacter sp. MB36-C1]
MKKIVDKINKKELEYSEEERPLYHLNCAEILLMAANEKYNLGIEQNTIKAICPFGGGIQSEKTCGALLGAVAALGVLYAEELPTTNEKMKEMTKKLVEEFENEFGSLNCDYIKEHHRSEAEKCNPVKLRAAEVFDKVINED